MGEKRGITQKAVRLSALPGMPRVVAESEGERCTSITPHAEHAGASCHGLYGNMGLGAAERSRKDTHIYTADEGVYF